MPETWSEEAAGSKKTDCTRIVRSVCTRSEVVEPVLVVVTTLRMACARKRSDSAIRLWACHMSSGVVGRRETEVSPEGSTVESECLGFVKRILAVGGWRYSNWEMGSRIGRSRLLEAGREVGGGCLWCACVRYRGPLMDGVRPRKQV